MRKQTKGIHHISAIVGHPQQNYNFYTKVLGLRMIKQTVNYDDPQTYHLYFADEQGSPGTVMTFFPWPNAHQGVIGDGQVGITTYAVPPQALSFWEKRLSAQQVDYVKTVRFGETFLQFKDVHGLNLELVEREQGKLSTWESYGVTADKAIKGFGGSVLYSTRPDETMSVLVDVLGLTKIAEEGDYVRYTATDELGQIIDVKKSVGVRGRMGVGVVHHIAWRAEDKADHVDWQNHAFDKGMQVTAIKDRNYFDAIYFREPGQILFEIATDGPGFTIDEPLATLGEKLMLPPQYEPNRAAIKAGLVPLRLDRDN